MRNLSWTKVRFSRRWLGMPLVLLLGLVVTMGCVTVVTPLKPGTGTPLESPDHGYVLGECTFNGMESLKPWDSFPSI